MYDQGLLTWQFPGMTNSVENRKTMISGGGGG